MKLSEKENLLLDMVGFIRSKLKKVRRRVKMFERQVYSKKSVSIAKKIEESENPLDAFRCLQERKFIPIHVLWNALAFLNGKRSPVYDLIVRDKSNVKSEELLFLIKIHESLISPSPILPSEILEFVNYYKERKSNLKTESEYRRLLIALIAKKIHSSKAFSMFSNAELIDTISVHQVLKILHKASVEGEYELFCNLKEIYSKEMNSAALVKIKYWEARIKNIEKLEYKDVEASFCKLDKTLSKEFEKHLFPLFSSIPEENNMLDFQIVGCKLHKIKSELEEAVRKKKRYSIVRLNDGEGYGFPDALSCVFDMERQELHWWGEVLATDLREKIQMDFRRSLHQHNLVGIPSAFRFIDELSINRDYSIYNNALLCRLFTLCHGYLSEYRGESYITEGQINLYLFDKGYIDRLSSLAQHVVFISGAKKEYLQRVFSDLQQASYIELPTHRLLKAEKFSYSEAAQPLPYVYENYIEQIRQLAGPGVVFFISAGFIGKIFAAEVAKNGGVALDVGQTLMNIVANHVDA